ncbi:MAG TPA: dihydroneopterin triphosphate diphosphatase [Burkholderiales bacterium]|nr:dihydroneopterin triphosphate diphosphatase [Burkholderiales bacterium]
MSNSSGFKRPESVLLIVHTRDGKLLLLKRADLPEFWQSVTGALAWGETDPRQAAARELAEETGIAAPPDVLCDLGLVRCFPIFPQFRDRYDPEVTHNVEHTFALQLAVEPEVILSAEHTDYGWFAPEVAVNKAASWTDRAAIQALFAR